jgi:hypothetical protein
MNRHPLGAVRRWWPPRSAGSDELLDAPGREQLVDDDSTPGGASKEVEQEQRDDAGDQHPGCPGCVACGASAANHPVRNPSCGHTLCHVCAALAVARGEMCGACGVAVAGVEAYWKR